MNISLFKLNNNGFVELNNIKIFVPKYFYENTSINELKDVVINGYLELDYDDNVVLNANLSGIMVLSDAYTLDNVDYKFNTSIDENIGNYSDFYNKNKNVLDILPFIWENIVSEVPIRVTKEEKPPRLSGDGWELNSSN